MEDKVKKSLRYSIFDGAFANVMLAINETFMTPYALSMRASAALIGILSSLPNLAGSLMQMKSSAFSERLGSRKSLINISILVHALMLVPIVLIPYIFKSNQVIFLIIFYAICAAFNGLAFPAWSSMMSDLVPDNERGKFFGRRSAFLGVIYVAAMIMSGAILYLLNKGMGLQGEAGYRSFTIIFMIAFISRLISWGYLRKMYEPPLIIKDEHRFTIFDFLKRVKRSNFGKFVMFVAAMNFAVYMASPFFAVYMLGDLKFNYMTFTIITIAAQLTMFVSMGPWGLHADHVGNRKIFRTTSVFIPLVPIMWIFSHNIAYLVAIQIFAGFIWAGFNLSAQDFIFFYTGNFLF